ncbi:MAG: hypothetical protein EAX87_03425 [Candidatus Thorarchaeota archaeon]|nr:hypothetical protein [Candidatus Thorarchaeota archaeon]
MLMYYLPIIFTAIICYCSFRESQWLRKKRSGMIFLLLGTLVISPFLIGSQIEINAYYFGKKSVSANFSLSLGEHNKLGPLSNQGALYGSHFSVRILVENGNVTFYIVDENRPDVFYYLDNYANETFLSVSLPYPVANWTANYYNPSQNQTIDVNTQIMLLVILIFPSPLAQRMQVLLIPHQILATLWICAGVASFYQWRLKTKQENSEF